MKQVLESSKPDNEKRNLCQYPLRKSMQNILNVNLQSLTAHQKTVHLMYGKIHHL